MNTSSSEGARSCSKGLVGIVGGGKIGMFSF